MDNVHYSLKMDLDMVVFLFRLNSNKGDLIVGEKRGDVLD